MLLQMRRGSGFEQKEAVRNARVIGLALFEFEMEYGIFPSDTAAVFVTESHPSHGLGLTGKSSNAMFRQLIAAGMFRQLFAAGFTQIEWVFYAKVQNARKSDGITLPGKALEKGECGFAYISGLSSKEDPITPIVLSPMISGTTKFNPESFRGKAVVLFTDGSARSYKIGETATSTTRALTSSPPRIQSGKERSLTSVIRSEWVVGARIFSPPRRITSPRLGIASENCRGMNRR